MESLERTRALSALAWALAFAYSFAPFDLALPAGAAGAVAERSAERWLLGSLLHLAAFAGIGAIDALRNPRRNGSRSASMIVLARGLVLCTVVEIGQLFFPSRHPKLLDLIVNMSGLVCGHLAAGVVRQRDRSRRTAGFSRIGRLQPILVVAWGVFWSAAILLPARLITLETWDPTYALVLGNERTGDRPWEGELQYVAFYDRALPLEEVSRAFALPAANRTDSAARRDAGLLAAYDFTRTSQLWVKPEGELRGAELAIDLPPGSEWTAERPAALVIEEGSVLSSRDAAAALTRRIAASDAFTLEAWIRPGSLSQTGPARLVSVSESPWGRNVTLGQEGRTLHFRVRNRLNGANGDAYELVCPDALSDRTVHVVASYDQGVSTIFLDGEQTCPAVDLRQPSVLLGLGGGPVSSMAMALLAAISLTVVARAGSPLARLLVTGYAWLLAPMAASPFLDFQPPASLHVWFGPALTFAWLVLARRRAERF